MEQNRQLGREKREQYASIVTAVMPLLLRRARRLLRDDDEAWDLVQTTLERGCRSFDAFVDVPGSDCRVARAAAWLFTIMNNHFIDLTRLAWKRRRRMPVDILEVTAAAPPAEPEPIWADLTVADVRRASRQLPERLRRSFELFTFENCTIREIAARFGIPDGTVCSRLARARDRIKDLLLEELRCSAPARQRSGRGHTEGDERPKVLSTTEIGAREHVVDHAGLSGIEIPIGVWVGTHDTQHHR